MLLVDDVKYRLFYFLIVDKRCTLKPLCYWKWYYISHERIMQNWLRKKYKKHQICLRGGSFKTATYDGQTLVVCSTIGLSVFKVASGNLHILQNIVVTEGMLLLLNVIRTNTQYIVLNCGKVVAIYKLVDKLYKDVCMFYMEKHSKQLMQRNINDDIFQGNVALSFFSGQLCSINSVLQGNILYLFVQEKIFIWDLMKMVCHSEIKANSFLVAQGKQSVYISPDYHIIHGFGNDAQTFFSLKTIWRISQIEANKNILLALEADDFLLDDSNVRNICAWNKYTGEKLYEIALLLPDFCFLHPLWDILLGNVISGEDVCAISLKKFRRLWIRTTKRKENPFTNQIHALGFRNMAANRFLITTLESNTSYHIVDAKSGETLYTFGNSEINYVGFDILMFTECYKKYLTVQIYL